MQASMSMMVRNYAATSLGYNLQLEQLDQETTWRRCKTFIEPGSNLDFNRFQLQPLALTGRGPQLLSAQAALRVVIILVTSAHQDSIISKNSSDFQYTRHAKITHFSPSVFLKA
jgi:hypothetical protein